MWWVRLFSMYFYIWTCLITQERNWKLINFPMFFIQSSNKNIKKYAEGFPAQQIKVENSKWHFWHWVKVWSSILKLVYSYKHYTNIFWDRKNFKKPSQLHPAPNGIYNKSLSGKLGNKIFLSYFCESRKNIHAHRFEISQVFGNRWCMRRASPIYHPLKILKLNCNLFEWITMYELH